MIVLDEKFRIEEDLYCWTLIERYGQVRDKDNNNKPKVDENGDPVWREKQSYHGELSHALTSYMDQSIKKSQNIQDVIDEIRTIEARIIKLYADIKRSRSGGIIPDKE